MTRKAATTVPDPDVRARLDEKGHEIPDPRPMAIPAGFEVPETLEEMMQRLVRTTISQEAAARGEETWEESDDFEIPDGDDLDDPSTPWEEWFDPVLNRHITAQEFKENEAIYRERYEEAHRRAYEELDRSAALRRAIRPEEFEEETPVPRQTGSGAGSPRDAQEGPKTARTDEK